MAVKNTLVKQETKEKGVAEYKANGEPVKLSASVIKQYLVSGRGNVTNEEVFMFLSVCRYQHLNPFLREVYLIKYSDSDPAAIVVGKDTLLKRAKREPSFVGFQAGIIVESEGGLEEREGTFYQKDVETIVGGWAKVFVKGYDVPFYESVPLDEYIGRKRDGSPNGQWSQKPATMIRKVALMHALREAFPEQNSGLYSQEEIQAAQDVVLDEAAVTIAEAPETLPEKETPKVESVEDALFG